MNIVETFLNLLEQTAFFSLSYGNYLMICIALIFLYLGIAKGFEPLLMVPYRFWNAFSKYLSGHYVKSGKINKRYGRFALVFLPFR